MHAEHPLLYTFSHALLYTWSMDVAVSDLRANLSEWVARARGGTEVVVTDRGVAVARLTGVTTSATIDRLVEQGLISRPARPGTRPVATGRVRPRSTRSVSDLVSEHRR
jgi:prevent-host-death family protein